MLRPKPKRAKMGVKEVVRLIWPRHRRFVRSCACSVPGCDRRDIEVMHYRQGHTAGMQQTPPDWFSLPGCSFHHRTGGNQAQHTIGHEAWDKLHGVNSRAIVVECIEKTTDAAMRNYLREVLGMPNPAREIRDEDVLGAEAAE